MQTPHVMPRRSTVLPPKELTHSSHPQDDLIQREGPVVEQRLPVPARQRQRGGGPRRRAQAAEGAVLGHQGLGSAPQSTRTGRGAEADGRVVLHVLEAWGLWGQGRTA